MLAPSPELVALALAYGFDAPVYPVAEAFRRLGIGRSFGWELIARGELEIVHYTKRKAVITSASMAAYLHSKRQNSRASSAAGRRRKAS